MIRQTAIPNKPSVTEYMDNKAKKPELLINFGPRMRGSHFQSWFVSFQLRRCTRTQLRRDSNTTPHPFGTYLHLDESSWPSNANAKLMQIIMHCPQHRRPMKQSSQIC